AHYFFYQRSEYPKDCRDVQSQCSTSNSSGVNIIKPDGFEEPFEVFCNNDVGGGGWTVIQRRDSGAVNFDRSWSQYKDGFGFLSTEFWLGNEKLSYLTNQGHYELRVDIKLSNGASFYTTYRGFRITDEWGQYQVTHIGELESNATGTPFTPCPTNMIYGTCSCKATCEDPNGQSGCNRDCLGTEGCTCPAGFLMQGSDCISASECGCFMAEANLVIPTTDVVQMLCVMSGMKYDSVIVMRDMKVTVKIVTSVSYRDCQDVYDAGNTQDGVYSIMPTGWPGSPFNVHCRMHGDEGWTVFQRRTDDGISFYQNWDAYKDGFGNNINFWLGNEKLYYLTNQDDYKLRLDITTSDGTSLYSEFTEFQIESEDTNYKMNKLGSRTSPSGYAGYYLSNNKGEPFSTYDRDNVPCENFNCAEKHRSGWWHWNDYCSYCYSYSYCYYFQYSSSCKSYCTNENLNGVYNGGNGEMIFSYYYYYCNVQYVEMKIKPTS
ncbi:hypothetical protein BSL78_27477, partial [Apostichopus japonicus]